MYKKQIEPTTPYTSQWNVDTPGIRKHVKGADKGLVVWRSIHFDKPNNFIKTLHKYGIVKLGKSGQQVVSTSLSQRVVWDWQSPPLESKEIYILFKIHVPERFPILEVSDVVEGGEMEEIALLSNVGEKVLTFYLKNVKQVPISDFKFIMDEDAIAGFVSGKSKAYVFEGNVSYQLIDSVPRINPDTYTSKRQGLLELPRHFKYLPKLRYTVAAYPDSGQRHPYQDIEVIDKFTSKVCNFSYVLDYKNPNKKEVYVLPLDTLEDLQECKRIYGGEGWVDSLVYND